MSQSIAPIQNQTELRYQQATQYFTHIGMVHALKRQWQFIREPEQTDFLICSIMFTIGTIYFCTNKGIDVGREIAESLYLKNEKKDVVILCGGGAGFVTGVALSVTGNGLMIEHSNRIARWKESKMDSIVGNLMLEEFQDDPIWSQFQCPIAQSPIFVPARTPAGQVFEFDSLMQAANRNGIIKDIYNKRIKLPTLQNPQAFHDISYSIDACLKDNEMMIVIYKRFRHLATQKSMENGLSTETKQFFMSYRNALGEFVKPIYMEVESKITKQRNDVQSKPNVTETEAEHAEEVHTKKMSEFKEIFGSTPLSDLNWGSQRDWMELLNTRWMDQYHS